ncbi:hypothetical protein [Bacillus pseudomycoides]|uniref:hypothetical protein n=1 Tax=Bacillus pseudomycoides TaxID=64104 RepID=UPI00159BB2D4|nr:hypothetical protein [Bacillus pseudomycoides]
MNGVLTARELMTTAKIREISVKDKLHMILEKAENGDPKAIKVLKEINRILKQV